MPFNTPITWAAATLAVADLNSDVRDNIRWLGAGLNGSSKGIARVRNTANVSLTTSAAWNTVTFNTADIDIAEDGGSLWDAGTPNRLTFPSSSIALVGGCVRFDQTTANKALRIYLNGSSVLVEHDNIGVQTPAFTQINVATLYKFAAGDYIQLQGYQDSGGALDALAEGAATPALWAVWMAVYD